MDHVDHVEQADQADPWLSTSATDVLFGANSTFGQSPDAPLGGTAVRQGETIFNMAHGSMYKSSKTSLILSSVVFAWSMSAECHDLSPHPFVSVV